MDAHDQTIQQQENGTKVERCGNSDINDAVQSVDFIARRRPAVSSRNVAIYIPKWLHREIDDNTLCHYISHDE